MCITGVLPEFTVHVPSIPIILAFNIGDFVNIQIPASAFAPEVEYDKNVDQAERDIFDCLLENSGGSLRTEMIKIKSQGKKLIVKEADLPGTTLGTWQNTSSNPPEATIKFDREAIAEYAKGINPSDSADSERKIEGKVLANVFVHEVCHNSYGHSGTDEPGQFDPDYYTGAMGSCEKNGYVNTIGGLPPFFQDDLGGNVSATLSGCLVQIFADSVNTDYFQSVISAVTAQAATPGGATPIDWHPESNPNY